jgi:pimeloyl-ACP methyl ester carboxylesterase
MLPRLGYALRALFDFVVTGTLFRYIVASWKYAAFFAFPYVCIALFGLAGVGLAGFAARLAELTGVPAAASAIVISVAAFLALMKWFGPHRINHILDDTIFSWQFLHGRRPELEKRLDEFAARILERAEKADVDEIVIVGHSLGAAMAIATVARCLIKDSQFGKRGLALHVLTVGATIPKFSLHPKGDQIRKAARIVADELSISWVEYQARDDVISFYRFDPVTLKRVSRDDLYGRPNIRRVQIHSMMNPASYKRHRFDFMRIHYQFLMGNDQRAPYDYCMVICGPLDFRCVTALTGAVGRISADGSMINEATADQ